MEVNELKVQGPRHQKDDRWFFSRAIATVPDSCTKLMRMAFLHGESCEHMDKTQPNKKEAMY